MSYIESRNEYILSVNSLNKKGDKYEILDYFTPDDVAKFVWLAVKEYIWKEKVSILDPMWWSWNLFYHVVKTIWKDQITKSYLNSNDNNTQKLYSEIFKEVLYIENSIWSITDIKDFKQKVDIVIVNPPSLNKKSKNSYPHNLFQNLSNKYCFILDTWKDNINELNWYKLDAIISLWDSVWIWWKNYFLYIYRNLINTTENKIFEKIQDWENINKFRIKWEFIKSWYSNNIFYWKKNEIIIWNKSFLELLEIDKKKNEIIPEVSTSLKNILQTQNIIIQNYNDLLRTISLESDFLNEYKTQYLMKESKIIDIISQIQSGWQKIESKKLYEILIALTVSNFLILSGPSWVGKTSLIDKISTAIWWKYLKFPIKSNFSDETWLIGYWNPLLSQYESTEVLKFLFQSNNHPDIPYFLLLDEMNLSRIENYFSEFLIKIDDLKENNSIKIKLFEWLIDNEIKWKKLKTLKDNLKIDLDNFIIKDENWLELRDYTEEKSSNKDDDEEDDDEKTKKWKKEKTTTKRIFDKTEYFYNYTSWKYIELYCEIRSNLHIIWTINEDETTFSLSNKVLDRAFYIELWVEDLFDENTKWDDNKIWDDKGIWKDDNNDNFSKNINLEEKYIDITKKYKSESDNFDENSKNFFNDLNKIIQKINPMDAIWYRTINEISAFFEKYNFFLNSNSLKTEDWLNIKTESGDNISLENEFEKKEIIDIVLCQKVWPKMTNYFLLWDKENQFNEILKLLEENDLKIKKTIKLPDWMDIEIKFESYKKIENLINILFNN